MSRFGLLAATTAGAVLALANQMAPAQTARSGGAGAASAQMMQQLQQLASERTALQAENARIKKELEAAKKERDTLKNIQQLLEQRAKEAAATFARDNAQRDSTGHELTQTKAKMQELIAKFRETVETLRTIETESTTAKQSLATRDQELKTCVDRNTALLNLNNEILASFQKHGALSRLARAEPFTQIGRIREENLVDDYKSRAADLRVPVPTPSSPAPLTASPASPQAAATAVQPSPDRK